MRTAASSVSLNVSFAPARRAIVGPRRAALIRWVLSLTPYSAGRIRSSGLAKVGGPAPGATSPVGCGDAGPLPPAVSASIQPASAGTRVNIAGVRRSHGTAQIGLRPVAGQAPQVGNPGGVEHW